MLTDEQIAAIAKPFIQYIGTHWIYDRAIPEDVITDFARAIIQEYRWAEMTIRYGPEKETNDEN